MTTIQKIGLLLLGMAFLAQACSEQVEMTPIQPLPTAGIAATAPYLTHAQDGSPVLVWTEQAADSLFKLKYAVYDTIQHAFGHAVSVTASIGCSTTPESMGKVAFKADGTVVALFAKRFPTEKNPFAGAIYYSLSADGGESWSTAHFLHSDTTHAYGRSFFDVATLKDGEVAAIWLDGRFGKEIKGSALFFSKTQPGAGFESDSCIAKGTCECCRTDILCDDEGNLHLAYRTILFPSQLAGQQVRDMVYQSSMDGGQTFCAARPISDDHWAIEACPHSGPSLAVQNNTIAATWFTAGGGMGLYFAQATAGSDFSNRKLLTSTGRHPQLLALENGQMAMICEETMQTQMEQQHHNHMDHGAGGMMHQMQAGAAKISLRVLDGDHVTQKLDVTDGMYADHHAVLTHVPDGVLAAWVREEAGGSRLCYRMVRF